jgi:dTDP-4-dehydrorhamnose 3,5-epimerase-like enzyme
MAYIIELKNYQDDRGCLNVFEKEIPFDIKRVYYIHNVSPDSIRGGHRHKKSWQALICLGGSCEIYNNNGEIESIFQLDAPNKILILEPKDWHTMQKFTSNATLLVLASTKYDINEYIDEPYEKH